MPPLRFPLPLVFLTAFLLHAAPARQQGGGDAFRATLLPIIASSAALLESPDEVFNKLESACAEGDPNQFSPLLAQKIFLNFFTGENGSFSANQAYFILRKFFSEHKVFACSLPTRSVRTSAPYATGQIQYVHRGVRYTALIYAALVHTDDRWLLSHFTISQRP